MERSRKDWRRGAERVVLTDRPRLVLTDRPSLAAGGSQVVDWLQTPLMVVRTEEEQGAGPWAALAPSWRPGGSERGTVRERHQPGIWPPAAGNTGR